MGGAPLQSRHCAQAPMGKNPLQNYEIHLLFLYKTSTKLYQLRGISKKRQVSSLHGCKWCDISYLCCRNIIINNIDYDFADYTSSVGSKFYYNISGTLTLQRTINTQIPDEDQAIQW